MTTNQLSFVPCDECDTLDLDSSNVESSEFKINESLCDCENRNADDRSQSEQESIELARQLMAEEAIMSYQQHFQFLGDFSDGISEEDLEAMKVALEVQSNDFASHETEYDPGDDLSYDTLLLLGSRIGDVKTERWSLRAAKEIEKLPIYHFLPVNPKSAVKSADIDETEIKCLVCQCEYETSEIICRLPCKHSFHKTCVSHWLSEKDVCPYCRQCISNND